MGVFRMKYVRRSRRNRPAEPRRQDQDAVHQFATADRARLFGHFDRLQRIHNGKAVPNERRLVATAMACIRSANRLAAVVLP